MDFERIQQVSDIRLDGIEVEVERRDGNIAGLVLRDKAGHQVRVVAGGYSETLSVLVPAKRRATIAHFVSYTRNGDRIEERFAQQYTAEERGRELARVGIEAKVEARECAGFQNGG